MRLLNLFYCLHVANQCCGKLRAGIFFSIRCTSSISLKSKGFFFISFHIKKKPLSCTYVLYFCGFTTGAFNVAVPANLSKGKNNWLSLHLQRPLGGSITHFGKYCSRTISVAQLAPGPRSSVAPRHLILHRCTILCAEILAWRARRLSPHVCAGPLILAINTWKLIFPWFLRNAFDS